MSKELAEALGCDGADEETLERFEELMSEAPDPDLDPEELDERIRRAREGEYLPIRVESWDELWERR